MKILVPTGTHPSKNSSHIIYIKNILKNLDCVSCVWFLFQPKKIMIGNNSKNNLDVLTLL